LDYSGDLTWTAAAYPRLFRRQTKKIVAKKPNRSECQAAIIGPKNQKRKPAGEKATAGEGAGCPPSPQKFAIHGQKIVLGARYGSLCCQRATT
jgi:hypothetical protein